MITLTLKNVFELLQKKSLDVKLQEETNQVLLTAHIEDQDYPVFIRLLNNSTMLQLVTFMPNKLTPKSRNDVARLLHLFNVELDTPGFGMDENSGLIFFRNIIFATKGQFDEALLDKHLNAIYLVCKTFTPAIDALASGLITFDEVLKKASETSK
jgi:hypothetical protein